MDSGSWRQLLTGRNGIRSLALAGGVALHAVNVYVATTILPSVVADIGGLDYYAWNTTLFVVASIIGSALSAALLAAAGPRRAYAIAASCFGIGTYLCAVAPAMPLMLVGRTIQGLGGGVLFALSYAMIRIVFDARLWTRAMALVSGMWGVATLVGPAVGGTFAEFGAWRTAFWIMIPPALLFGTLAFVLLPSGSDNREGKRSLPMGQLGVLTGAILAVSIGSVSSELLWNAFGAGAAVALLAGLVALERTAPIRLLPRGSLSLSTHIGLLFATMALLAVAVTSSEIFAPLFLQVLHAQSPLVSGYLAAAMAAGWTVGSIASSSSEGRSADRAILIAPVLAVAGMVTLALLVPRASAGEPSTIAPIAVALVLVGTGVGIGWPHLLTRVLQAAPDDEQDLASASITTVQLSATAIGAAMAGLIVNLGGLTDPGGIEGTADAAQLLFAGFTLAPLAAIVTVLRLKYRDEPEIGGSGPRSASLPGRQGANGTIEPRQ